MLDEGNQTPASASHPQHDEDFVPIEGPSLKSAPISASFRYPGEIDVSVEYSPNTNKRALEVCMNTIEKQRKKIKDEHQQLSRSN